MTLTQIWNNVRFLFGLYLAQYHVFLSLNFMIFQEKYTDFFLNLKELRCPSFDIHVTVFEAFATDVLCPLTHTLLSLFFMLPSILKKS